MKRPGLWLPLLSAVLLWSAFPPINFGWSAYIAFVPLLLSLRQGGFWRGWRRGIWFGFAFFLLNLVWLWQFVAGWTESYALAAIPWALLSFIEGLYLSLFGGIVSLCSGKWRWGLLTAPVVWPSVEHFRSTWPAGGFAWTQLSYSQWEHPLLVQPAVWAGTHFVAFIIVAVNVAIALSIAEREDTPKGFRLTPTIGIAAGYAIILLFSLLRFIGPQDEKTFIVMAAQPSLKVITENDSDWYPEFLPFREKVLSQAQAIGAKLVVFPEGYQLGMPMHPELARSAYVASGQRPGRDGMYETAFGITPGQNAYTMRDKVRLVVFGEYVPCRGNQMVEAFKIPGGDVKAGDYSPPLRVGELSVGVAICFESVFGEVLREQAEQGVDLLAVMSIDDWYPLSGMEQHAAASVVRAVENNKPLVRSGSSGITMIVDRLGRIIERLPIKEQSTIAARVGTTDSRPALMTKWFPWICHLFVLAGIVIVIMGGRRTLVSSN